MNIINSNDQDRFGFYRVGDMKFYSKLEAAHAHERFGQKMSWEFNDAVFSTYDWKIEPTETLEELYKQRAQQIRDKYDYVVLWFSGGADSNNILNAFINNDIKIDEVASMVNIDATKDKMTWLNAEIFTVAADKVERARLRQPGLVHRHVDLSKMMMDHFSHREAKFDWIYEMNGYLGPNNVSRRDIKMKVPEWAKMIEAGKRVVFIHGIDKPRLFQVKDHYYFRFADLIDTAVSPSMQMMNRPWEFDELFYWSPDVPKIVIKQAHILKKFAKGLTETSSDITTDPNPTQILVNNNKYSIHLNAIHSLIYPGWYPVPYQVKAPSLLFTPRDEWFYKLPDSDPAKYAWKTGLFEIWKRFPDKWKKDPSDMTKGFVPLFSKAYDLGS